MSALVINGHFAVHLHVRFTPDGDPKTDMPLMVMSALHLKADMCSAAGMSALGQ
jgi:hypothetical protein